LFLIYQELKEGLWNLIALVLQAISRRATLHEMVRDYAQAACDLRRLISVLGSQSNEKAKHSDSPNGSTGGKESRQAQQRLLTVEDQAKMGTPLDFYLIL
jgi:DnaJ family protein C protein 7